MINIDAVAYCQEVNIDGDDEYHSMMTLIDNDHQKWSIDVAYFLEVTFTRESSGSYNQWTPFINILKFATP